MKIAICASLSCKGKMREIEKLLINNGHIVYLPKALSLIESGKFIPPKTVIEKINAVNKYDFIREHFQKISDSDSILVVNCDKNGIKNYIGGNTLMEIGLAYWLNKKIYILNSLPDLSYTPEIAAMQPIILNGDFNHINNN